MLATATALCYYCGKIRLKASAAAKEATHAAKNNSRRIRICAVCFALLIMLIAAATYYFACRGTEYRILDDAEIQQMSARSEYSTEAQRTLAESALMLVGKVNYFWGGKSYTVGWDDRWGKPAEVTSPGHSTSGTTIPYGLDCSGFVLWCYIQLGADKTETIEKSASAHGISGINPLKLKKRCSNWRSCVHQQIPRKRRKPCRNLCRLSEKR